MVFSASFLEISPAIEVNVGHHGAWHAQGRQEGLGRGRRFGSCRQGLEKGRPLPHQRTVAVVVGQWDRQRWGWAGGNTAVVLVWETNLPLLF
jgi:hypothetical protein